MSRRWKHFPHDADVGVRGVGGSISEAFAEAARAMVAASVDPDSVRSLTSVEITCTGTDLQDLLYAWLNAVVYEMSTRDMLFGAFEVNIDDGKLRARAYGETVSPDRHEPAIEIKGATWTALDVRHEGGEWVAECVVDV